MNPARERCIELLIDRATHDLSAAGRSELEAILREHPEWDDDGFELAAASLDLAAAPETQTMPEAVRQQLARTAQSWLDSR